MSSILKSEHISLAVCILLALMLTFLFIFPRQYLVSVLSYIEDNAVKARTAVNEGDILGVKRATEAMLLKITSASDILKLFLNHGDVDELKLNINACYRAVRSGELEPYSFMSGIESILQKCEYLFDVETLSLYNLF